MNDLQFSAKKLKNQKSRKACEAHDHSAVSSAVASAVRLAQDLRSHNKQASPLDGALDEAQNEVDSEAEDVIWRSKMDDIETWKPLSSPITSRKTFCEYCLKKISLFLSSEDMRQFWWRGGSVSS